MEAWLEKRIADAYEVRRALLEAQRRSDLEHVELAYSAGKTAGLQAALAIVRECRRGFTKSNYEDADVRSNVTFVVERVIQEALEKEKG